MYMYTYNMYMYTMYKKFNPQINILCQMISKKLIIQLYIMLNSYQLIFHTLRFLSVLLYNYYNYGIIA